jgi:tRNA(adenine34) deaminase
MDDAERPPEHEAWMREAIAEARSAWQAGDVPVGCVIIDNAGQVIARGRNRREVDHDPTAHAEVVAMREAASVVGSWRLVDCTLVVTLEPCAMCAGAIVSARVPTVVYGCPDPKAGAAGSVMNLLDHPKLNHRPRVVSGVLSDDCAAMLRSFFRAQRALGKK